MRPKKKLFLKLSPVTKCSVFLFSYVVTIINVINVSKFLKSIMVENFDNPLFRDLSFYKTLIILVTLVLVFFIVQPENLRYPAYFGAFFTVLSVAAMLFLNLNIGAVNAPNMVPFDFKHFFPFVGSQMYSMESVGVLVTVRSAMKRRSRAPKMIIYTMVLIFILFVSSGLSFYWGHLSQKDMGFFYFAGNRFMYVLQICFYLTTPSTYIISVITMMIMLEEISWIRDKLTLEENPTDLDVRKLRVFRTAVMTILLFAVYLSNIFM